MKNFAGLNSIVEFTTIDDNELYRVKIVDTILNNSQNENFLIYKVLFY